jgi:hypothetical protein
MLVNFFNVEWLYVNLSLTFPLPLGVALCLTIYEPKHEFGYTCIFGTYIMPKLRTKG